jgi:hypothetical protein
MTQIALQTHKKEMLNEKPSVARQKFLYRLSTSDYEKEWGKDYLKRPIVSRILAAVMRYMPKIGPFRAMAFKNPTPETEELYFKSINTTVDRYRAFLEEERTGSPCFRISIWMMAKARRPRSIRWQTTLTQVC